jgi:HD-GYP domain-containing protein (c-di-GMP phosphodiesterase class II)
MTEPTEAFRDLLVALRGATTIFDEASARHGYRVGQLSALTGNTLGLPHEDLHLVGWTGLLHDLGKIGLPRDLIRTRQPLGDVERIRMRDHPMIGAQMVRAVSSILDPLAAGIQSHHEHWDGTGYPDGLRGPDIPLAARIVAVTDAFDSLRHGATDDGQRLSRAGALARLEDGAGTRFDPAVVAAFLGRLQDTRPRGSQADDEDIFPLGAVIGA